MYPVSFFFTRSDYNQAVEQGWWNPDVLERCDKRWSIAGVYYTAHAPVDAAHLDDVFELLDQ